MKLSIKLLALFAVAGFVGCSTIEPIEPSIPTDRPVVDENGMIDVTIKASVGSAATKVSTDVNKDNFGLNFGWEGGDKIAFIPSNGATEGTSSILTVSEGSTSELATLTGKAKAGVKNRLIIYPSTTAVSPISYDGTTAHLDVSYQNWNMNNFHKNYANFADALFMINDDGERDAITAENVSNIPSVNFAHINACLTLRISFKERSLGDFAEGVYKLKRIILQDMPVKADIDLTKNPEDANFMTEVTKGAMNIEVSNSPGVEEISDVLNEHWIPVPIFAMNGFKKDFSVSIVLEREDYDGQTYMAYQNVTVTPNFDELVAGTNNAVSVEVTRVKEMNIGGKLMINEILCDPNEESDFVDFNDQDFFELMNVTEENITWVEGQMRMTVYNDGANDKIALASMFDPKCVITDGNNKVTEVTTLAPDHYFVQKGEAGVDMIHNTENFVIVEENVATLSDGETIDTENPFWIPIETLNLSAMDVDDLNTLRYSFGYKTSVKKYVQDPTNTDNAWGIPIKGCTYGRENTQLGDNIFINEYALKYTYNEAKYWPWGALMKEAYYDDPEDENWIELYNSTIDPIELLVKEKSDGTPISGVQIYRLNGGCNQEDDMYTIEDGNHTDVILGPKKYFTISNDTYNSYSGDNHNLAFDIDYSRNTIVGEELILIYGKWQSGSAEGKIVIDNVPIWDLTANQSSNKTYTWAFARDTQSRNWYVEKNPTLGKDNSRDGAAIAYTRPTDGKDIPKYTKPTK